MESPSEFPQLQKLQTDEVSCCDFNSNYLLALGSSMKNIRILEWKTGLGFVDMFYSPLSFHKYGVTSVRFSPKGTMLASASLDGTAVLTNVYTGTKVFVVVQYNKSNIKFCEFTFDSTKLITGADDGILCIWDIIHHRQIRHCRLHEDDYSLRGLAVSPDSEYLLSIDSGNMLKLWYIGEITFNHPRCIFLKKSIHDDILCCDFSPVKNTTGGTSLKLKYCVATSGANGLVKIWDVIIGGANYSKCDFRLVHVLKHDHDVLCVRFNSEGDFIATTAMDNLVKLWKTNTGICLKTLKGHNRYVTCAAFSKESLVLATGSIDKSLIIWDLSEDLITLDSELSMPCDISMHFTNINVINCHTGAITTDQQKKYDEFTVLQNLTFPSTINSVLFPRDDVLAVAGGQKIVEIWKRGREKLVFEQQETLKELDGSINFLDAIPIGDKIISCSADGMMILWDINMNLTFKMKSPNCTGSLKVCKFSPDSKYIIAAGDDATVYLWDANNLEFIRSIQEYEDSITAVDFTPDSKYFVSTCGSSMVLQNLNENKAANQYYNAHDLGVLCCDFSFILLTETETADHAEPNERKYVLATGGNDSLVKVWEISPPKILNSRILSGHGASVNYVKFSSTEPFTLASCSSDTTVRIWDAKRKYCLHVLSHHQSAVTSCSFSKDSTMLATGSLDKTVLILNITERSFHEPMESDQNSFKVLEKWTQSDLVKWFSDMGLLEFADNIQSKHISGRELLNISEDEYPEFFGITREKNQRHLKFAIHCLKKSLAFPREIPNKNKNTPHKFLCPITHQIMKDPVICTDGYTYDRASITEWFLCGKLISPVTQECLRTTKLLPYSALKINIYNFLYKDECK